jgi:hypothetical protein
LTQITDFTPYGQLLSRAFGLAVSQGKSLINCIQEGRRYENNKDYTDVGICVGTIFSQIIDASFNLAD